MKTAQHLVFIVPKPELLKLARETFGGHRFVLQERLPERCPYCGALVETPCDEPPPDTCEKALEAIYK